MSAVYVNNNNNNNNNNNVFTVLIHKNLGGFRNSLEIVCYAVITS